MKPTGPFLEVVSGADEQDAELEQVLGAARAWSEPSRHSRERVAAALRAALPDLSGSSGLSHALGRAVAPTNPARPSARRAARLGRVSLAIVGGACIGALGFWLGHGVGHGAGQRDAVVAARDALAAPARDAPAPEVEPAAPERPRERQDVDSSPVLERAARGEPATVRAAPSSPPRSRVAVRRVAPASSAGAAEPARLSFRQVLDQLRRAQQQLRNGQATLSLMLLSELDRGAGDVLLEERDATRVLALCAAGQDEAAREVARRLEHESPRSIYGMRLEASCISDPWP